MYDGFNSNLLNVWLMPTHIYTEIYNVAGFIKLHKFSHISGLFQQLKNDHNICYIKDQSFPKQQQLMALPLHTNISVIWSSSTFYHDSQIYVLNTC